MHPERRPWTGVLVSSHSYASLPYYRGRVTLYPGNLFTLSPSDGETTPKVSFIPAQGTALGSKRRQQIEAPKARLIIPQLISLL